jgi:hypothetical protein
MSETSQNTEAHLRELYHAYRHTISIPQKGVYFSPTCLQVCRPIHAFAATNRETIIQYLIEAAGFKNLEEWEEAHRLGKDKDTLKRNYYSIRPLSVAESEEVLEEDVTEPLGISPEELKQTKIKEGWVGMRVDLWDEQDDGCFRFIEVKYWWRKEEGEWTQCLHDIMSIDTREALPEGDDLID